MLVRPDRSRRFRSLSTPRLVLHLLIALGGYLRHGDYVTPNILDALPQSAAVGAARLAIVCAFAFTYPMMIFLCRMHIGAITARRARLRFSLWGAITAAGAAQEVGEEAGEEAEQIGSASASASASTDDLKAFDVDEAGSDESAPAAAEAEPLAKPFGGEEDHVRPDTIVAWCLPRRWPYPLTPTPDPNQVVVTVLLVSLSLAAAFLFPNIDQLFGLLGGTTARLEGPGLAAAHAANTAAPEAHPLQLLRAALCAWESPRSRRLDCLWPCRHHRCGHLLRRPRTLLGEVRRLHVPVAPPAEALLPGAPPTLRPKPNPDSDPDPYPYPAQTRSWVPGVVT